ncbi:YigZ family protein [Porphyromonadaceae bacterium W3.11]|nr:YigZ family protein [Porphyromonadaceae bacterium W3.11]
MKKVHSYRTISSPSEGLYTEKRSKFISHALPVSSESEAMVLIDEFRKKYYDARHVCWAYRVGKYEMEERANDDGEPSSTAGKPILGQIHSHELTDVLIIVIRYFGGVKLGTGGLITAYKSAAAEAIHNNTIEERILYTRFKLQFPFDLINPVMMLLKNHDAETIGNDADVNGHIWIVRVSNAIVDEFEAAAEALYQLRLEEIDDEDEG